MGEIENKKARLRKLLKIRTILLNIFGGLLLVTAITGIKSFEHYIPTWLNIALVVALIAFIILFIITSNLRKQILSLKNQVSDK